MANNRNKSEQLEKKRGEQKQKWKDIRDKTRCQENKRSMKKQRDNRQDRERDLKFLRQGFWTYTPLIAPREVMLMQIENKQIVKWPIKMRNPRRNRSKYCMFHKEVVPSANDCYQVKKEIEHLIKKGHLGEFVRNEISLLQQHQLCQASLPRNYEHASR